MYTTGGRFANLGSSLALEGIFDAIFATREIGNVSGSTLCQRRKWAPGDLLPFIKATALASSQISTLWRLVPSSADDIYAVSLFTGSTAPRAPRLAATSELLATTVNTSETRVFFLKKKMWLG